MDETAQMFHSYNSHQPQYPGIREIIENVAHEYNGKLFWYSLNQFSIRMTYLFDNNVDNLLFRHDLYNLGISYQTTGLSHTTYIVLNLLDFESYFS